MTSHFFGSGAWELDDSVIEELASELQTRFAAGERDWSEVVRAVVRVVDPHISLATLGEAAGIAFYLGEDDVARWLDRLIESPDVISQSVELQGQNHAKFMGLGPFVRRKAAVRDGVSEGCGPWHASDCRFVARAGDLSRWEGVERLPDEGRLCSECRAGQPAAPAHLPLSEQDRARDQIREAIASLGSFVRRSAEDGPFPVPAGKWHAAGCRTTRAASDVRLWEGVDELPSGQDFCKTCLRDAKV